MPMKSNLLFTVVAVAGGSAMILGLSSARAARPGTPATPGAVTEGTLVRIDSKSDLAEPCPLKHTDVKAEISGFIARVNVTQESVNPAHEKIEAVYKFPLPPNSAV